MQAAQEIACVALCVSALLLHCQGLMPLYYSIALLLAFWSATALHAIPLSDHSTAYYTTAACILRFTLHSKQWQPPWLRQA
jgi:hypothetical protein